MGFEGRRKGKYKVAEKFVDRIRKIQEEVKAVLGKAQEEMKKFANRKRREEEEYRVEDLVLLSTKDLVANERKEIGETDQALCRPLQSKRNCLE